MPLASLKRLDGLRDIAFAQCRAYVHEDHRFVLPLIFSSQQERRLPQPCKIIMFDRHHDALVPREQAVLGEVAAMRQNGFSLDDLIAFCNESLCRQDDDWLKAGMGLGLISDGVVFGVENRGNADLESFTDSAGTQHLFKILSRFPGPALEHQGELSDLARANEFRPIWEILDWEHIPQNGFRFNPHRERILLDIDLDAFVMCWSDYVFPWPEEVFEDRFLKLSNSVNAEGWTGKWMFQELLQRVGLLTVAREPQCCGGQKKAREVWRKMNKFLFDGGLKVTR
jgi:hypothetical protein